MYGWLAKSTFAKLKLVKNRGISWGNAFSKSCSQWSLEFMHLLGLTLPCRVAWQMWPQDINDINSKTKNLDPEYFCMLTPVGMLYNIYFRISLTCTVQKSVRLGYRTLQVPYLCKYWSYQKVSFAKRSHNCL